jgi:hypothetical protein
MGYGGFRAFGGGDQQMAPVRPRNKQRFDNIHERFVMRGP